MTFPYFLAFQHTNYIKCCPIFLHFAKRHSNAVKRWATLLLRTAMLMARGLPANTQSLRARVMAV